MLAGGTFCPVRREEMLESASILGGRFACTMKNVGTESEKRKARYVAQGHKDKEMPFIVHNIKTLRRSPIKIIVSTAAVRNSLFFSHDVTQADFQSDEEMSWEIYLRPKEGDRKYFRVTGDVMPEILRAFYGMMDASDYWGVTCPRESIHSSIRGSGYVSCTVIAFTRL